MRVSAVLGPTLGKSLDRQQASGGNVLTSHIGFHEGASASTKHMNLCGAVSS